MNPDMSVFLGAEQFLGLAKAKAALTITVLGSSPSAHWSAYCALNVGFCMPVPAQFLRQVILLDCGREDMKKNN